jgi:hypothetical protein
MGSDLAGCIKDLLLSKAALGMESAAIAAEALVKEISYGCGISIRKKRILSASGQATPCIGDRFPGIVVSVQVQKSSRKFYLRGQK